MPEQQKLKFLSEYLPFWSQITEDQKRLIENSAVARSFGKGELLLSGPDDCVGMLLVTSGQLRVYIVSDGGKEITLYRLFERDICILSASCMMKNINFDIYVQAEKDSGIILVPTSVYNRLNKTSLPVSDYTNELMSSRFSDVMWIMEQVLFTSFDKRLAHFLIEQSSVDATDNLEITHDAIARHLGTAREVVTRMLKYFQSEGMVSLSRGGITILDRTKLEKLIS
ncbi:MAG: Crp/Fnr family transcriptional regulator [Bacillota bacterium]|nr:Crp/Fnr family transcriptional regulator [Bacillota bacterium]